VGCGVGNLVVAATEQGFDAEGIDVDPIATDEARKNGRPVRTATLEQVQGSYDVLVVNHVLEHIEDLEAFLAHVSRVLTSAGRFFVLSPHYKGLIPRLLRGRWMGWVPREHFWHFTPGTLAATVEQMSPLTLVRSSTEGVIEPPVGGVKGIAVAALTAVSKGLGRGDQVEAIFEKPAP
jgi:2-polyprenyl-3-methyl-5-hydroxy-6-metoxy-1,4-benzoquinol methylase